MKGSEWWAQKVPENLGDDYTFEILEAIRAGHAVFEWQTMTAGDLEFQIVRAPLAIGTFDDHVFLLGLSAEAVDMIAQELAALGVEVMSPTPYLYDVAVEHESHRQIGPHTIGTLIPGASNGAIGKKKSTAKLHADAIARDRPESCSNIVGACKTYVLHPYLADPSDHVRDDFACEYGWRLVGKVGWGSANSSGTGWIVQSAQWAHLYRQFFDYSEGAIFVHAHARLRGVSVDLRKLARGGPDSARVAPAGPVPFILHPKCRAPLRGSQGPATEPSPPVSLDERPVLRLGSKGSAVGDWQRILMSAGFDLAPYNDDDDFGKLTHNGTVGFQRERGLAGTGVVDDATWSAVGTKPIKRDEPDGGVTAVIRSKNFTWAKRTTVDNLVVHTIEAKEASTTGDNTAYWFAGKYVEAPRASAHYCFDDDSTILCVPEEHVAWAAPGLNRRGIQLEHAGYARQSLEQWLDPFSRRMLARSAKLAAAACKRWNIPVRFVDAEGLLRGERGITTHYQVTKGPGKGRTTHVDPGRYFPMSMYLDMINAEMNA